MSTLPRPSSSAVPAWPGAMSTFDTRGECASFHANACSRPPPPMTSSFMRECVKWEGERGETCSPHAASISFRACSLHPSLFTLHKSMPEMPVAGENHRNAPLVGGGEHFLIAQAAAGLDHRNRAGVGDDIEPVAKREERVRGDHRAGKRQAGVLGLDRGDARRVDAAHLAGADAACAATVREYDGVGFYVLRDAPCKQ